MTREEILRAAQKCVCGDRDKDYGSPEKSFEAIAGLWNDYLCSAGVIKTSETLKELLSQRVITAKDVAVMMVLFKCARIATGHGKDDNWIDIAGYAACGGEVERGNNESDA